MDTTPEIKQEVRRLKQLKQYRDASDAIVEKIASKNVISKNLVEGGNFIDDKEKTKAKDLFRSFLETHDFESVSDLNTLSMLIFQMILVDRIQKAINDCTNKDGKAFISDKLTKSLNEAIDQVLDLKLKLKIDNDEKVDELTTLQLLKKRFQQYIMENKNEFTCTCAACGNLLLLRRRVKDFDCLVHPSFAGRVYYNKEAIQMVKDNTLSKEAYAKIFHTSIFFVDWCLENEGKILPSTKNE